MNSQEFLKRFYYLNDAVIRRFEVNFKSEAGPSHINLTVDAQDREVNDENRWVTLELRVNDIQAFRFAEDSKQNYRVIFDDVKIVDDSNGVLIDFEGVEDDSHTKIGSNFYILGKSFSWKQI